MTLSGKAKQLLLIIDKATDRDWDAKIINKYYVPSSGDTVSGAGDARCLRSLETKGLIERMRVTSYAYAITEEGRLIAQTLEQG